MPSLLYLMGAALFLGLMGLGAFLWALKSGQFEDLDGASHRVLFDDEPLVGEIQAPAAPQPAPRKGEGG